MFNSLHFTIKEFNKRLKRARSFIRAQPNFTIKEFNKRLKRGITGLRGDEILP